MQTSSTSEFLRTSEAAEYLGLSRFTLAAWRKSDQGPAYVRLGHAVRYRRADLDAWAAARRVRAGAA